MWERETVCSHKRLLRGKTQHAEWPCVSGLLQSAWLRKCQHSASVPTNYWQLAVRIAGEICKCIFSSCFNAWLLPEGRFLYVGASLICTVVHDSICHVLTDKCTDKTWRFSVSYDDIFLDLLRNNTWYLLSIYSCTFWNTHKKSFLLSHVIAVVNIRSLPSLFFCPPS